MGSFVVHPSVRSFTLSKKNVSKANLSVLIIFYVLHHLSRVTTKQTKWHVRPVKTQIRPGWCWSESSLSAWRKLGPLATHWAHSEDWTDWADAQADLSLRWAHSRFVGFIMRRLNFGCLNVICNIAVLGIVEYWWSWSLAGSDDSFWGWLPLIVTKDIYDYGGKSP